jgi:hypothetical protein
MFCQFPELLSKGPVISLIGSHPSSFSSTTTSPSSDPTRKNKLTRFSVRFLGCQELFSNSHLSIIRECSPWVHPQFIRTSLLDRLAIMRTIWSEWTWAWWFIELVWDSWAPITRTSLPPLNISGTFWSEWTRSRWSPLALCKMSLEYPVGFPN